MAQRTTCYRSDAGKDFPTEFEALKDDLRHFIVGVIKNDALARDLTDAMVDKLEPVYSERPADLPAGKGYVPETLWPGTADLMARLKETRQTNAPQLPLEAASAPPRDTRPTRPQGCRDRLQETGQPHPKTGCAIEGCNGAISGCLYDPRTRR